MVYSNGRLSGHELRAALLRAENPLQLVAYIGTQSQQRIESQHSEHWVRNLEEVQFSICRNAKQHRMEDKMEHGVPADYDRYVPHTETKRRIVETKECGNCGEEFYADYGEFHPPPELNHWNYKWCSPECFLAYAHNSVYPRIYTALEAAVNSLENRQVQRRPSRFHLISNGGTMTIEQYKQGEPRPTVEVGTKRQKQDAEDMIDAMDVE